MGGCCCSSRRPQLHGAPVYYYCPPASEEHESLTSNDSAVTALSTGILVDLHLDRSIPETYQPPPAPIPYDVVLGGAHVTDSESGGERASGINFDRVSCMDLKDCGCEVKPGSLLASQTKLGVDLLKFNTLAVSTAEEEDVCPTCLEEYDMENPRIVTKCKHHFHLSCILEWMERSDSCPICDQEMEYEAL